MEKKKCFEVSSIWKSSERKWKVFWNTLVGEVCARYGGQQTPWASSKQQGKENWCSEFWEFWNPQQKFSFIPGWQQIFQSLFIVLPAWGWGCVLQWKSGLPKPFPAGFLTLGCSLQLLESCHAKELCMRRVWHCPTFIPAEIFLSCTDLTVLVWWDLQILGKSRPLLAPLSDQSWMMRCLFFPCFITCQHFSQFFIRFLCSWWCWN